MMEKKRTVNEFGHVEGEGLYRADFEHSSCGIGFVANLKGNLGASFTPSWAILAAILVQLGIFKP